MSKGRTRRALGRLSVLLLGLTAMVLASCTKEDLIEASLRACHNGIDDDENGKTDCADAACVRFCETTDAACTNGIDDDEDGTLDCRDQECRELDACQKVSTKCAPLSDEGCAFQRACYETTPLTSDAKPYCTAPGTGAMGDACESHEDCLPQHACKYKHCTRRCSDQLDCPKESACLAPKNPGICTLPCTPETEAAACGTGKCLPSQLAYLGFGEESMLFFCHSTDPVGSRGEGELCEYGVQARTAAFCSPTLVCAPTKDSLYGQGRCRSTCGFGADGASVTHACADASSTCARALPTDPRAPMGGQTLLGLCLPLGESL